MADKQLKNYVRITPDPSDVAIPALDWSAEHTLNGQTGFNRPLLQAHRECGCFHCGRRFPTSLITSWMVEDGEEETGLCPYCGVDALIVGDETHPLTTALLTMLYGRWFETERNEHVRLATDLPHFTSWDDYLRKGIPFQCEIREGRRLVAEVPIFSVGSWDGQEEYDDMGYPIPAFGRLGDAEPGGVWHVRGPFNDDGSLVGFELVGADGGTIPFEPWSGHDQDEVERLVDQHGDALRGVFSDPGFDCLRLFVVESPERD
ncbi:MAG: hypothetical protein Q4A01_07700 [Coriobacteriales bacterium]|nr:hypothetical protein [Coriobacteriales bacterium]